MYVCVADGTLGLRLFVTHVTRIHIYLYGVLVCHGRAIITHSARNSFDLIIFLPSLRSVLWWAPPNTTE